MRIAWGVGLVLLLIVASCTGAREPEPSDRSPAPPPVSPEPSPEPSPAVELANGRSLPADCEPSAPRPAAFPVTFVASGAAWAVSENGRRARCLFPVADAGPFLWGPLGDRVALDRLEVRGLSDVVLHPAGDVAPGSLSWGHPVGIAIAFVAPDGSAIRKALLDRRRPLDVSPFGRATYREVTYHPSGRFLAFIAERGGSQAIWLSSNLGEDPRRLVFTKEDTGFGPIAFEEEGRFLFYGAVHHDGHVELHRLNLETGRIPHWWEGEDDQRILAIEPGRTPQQVAFDVGTTCDDRVAMVRTGPREPAPALPDEPDPTHAVGWLGVGRLVVASGPCEGPFDLSVVDVKAGAIEPIVSGVKQAALRIERSSPPGLPGEADEQIEVPPGAA